MSHDWILLTRLPSAKPGVRLASASSGGFWLIEGSAGRILLPAAQPAPAAAGDHPPEGMTRTGAAPCRIWAESSMTVRKSIPKPPRPRVIERRMSTLLRKPPSVRLAAGVIVTATAVVVVVAGILIRVLDHTEYGSIWVGMWWAIQTVTTVGYGDVTPHKVIGRIIASFVMLEGIAFLAVVTAAITSTFVARAALEHDQEETTEAESAEARLDAHFDDLAARLDRVEASLTRLSETSARGELGPASPPP
jgi:voltage-gated potassium channel